MTNTIAITADAARMEIDFRALPKAGRNREAFGATCPLAKAASGAALQEALLAATKATKATRKGKAPAVEVAAAIPARPLTDAEAAVKGAKRLIDSIAQAVAEAQPGGFTLKAKMAERTRLLRAHAAGERVLDPADLFLAACEAQDAAAKRLATLAAGRAKRAANVAARKAVAAK